tara:strand:- start:134 stop:598 length:465 start_codon:yes stop_codon:yes gene_type:complete
MIDVSDLNAAIVDFQKEVEIDVTTIQRKIAMDLLRGVVMKTPVDTGRARGNWQITIGAPASNELGSKDKTGSGTVSKGQKRVNSAKPYGIIWLTNNVPYIGVLEFGGFVPKDPGPSKDPRKGRTGRTLVKGGFSVQAPKGMVRVTLEEITRSLT